MVGTAILTTLNNGSISNINCASPSARLKVNSNCSNISNINVSRSATFSLNISANSIINGAIVYSRGIMILSAGGGYLSNTIISAGGTAIIRNGGSMIHVSGTGKLNVSSGGYVKINTTTEFTGTITSNEGAIIEYID